MTHPAPASVHPAQPYPAAAPRTNVLAIVAIVAGFLAPVAGIVTGHLALRQIARSGEEGRSLAITGLVAGYALTAFTVLFMIVWFGMFFSMLGGFWLFSAR
jgi:hypothetical protein